LDMAIHDFDLARHLMRSEVTEVYSTASVFGDLPLESVGDIDTAVTILKFKNKGGSAFMEASYRNLKIT